MTAHRKTTNDDDRIVLTATEARQGEIILGKRGRWIWGGSIALMALLILALAFWW